jgi:hypothetical protein
VRKWTIFPVAGAFFKADYELDEPKNGRAALKNDAIVYMLHVLGSREAWPSTHASVLRALDAVSGTYERIGILVLTSRSIYFDMFELQDVELI